MDYSTLESLIQQRKTLAQISQETGKGKTTIRYWLKKHGLKLARGPGGKLPKDWSATRRCGKCGETDPSKFYGHKRNICGKCHCKYTIDKGREKRHQIVREMGGCCSRCGYNEFLCALDIHHLDSELKDPNFHQMRSWSIERIREECRKCVLLCKNCHAVVHNGYHKRKDNE